MKNIKILSLTLLLITAAFNQAFALSCSAAQWAAADKSCAKVNGAGSCASSCTAITEHTAIVGCEGSQGFIVVDTTKLEANYELEALDDAGEDVIVAKPEEYRVKDTDVKIEFKK